MKKMINQLVKKKVFTKKQIKDIQILYDILEKRDIIENIINKRNELYINKLKKYKIKITDNNTYKIVKRNVVKKNSWNDIKYDIVKKNNKEYFCKTIPLYKQQDNLPYKKLTYLSGTNLLNKVKIYHQLNKISFVPKIIEVIIIKKKNFISEIKIISNYIKGSNLTDYLKKTKLNNKEKEILKNKIHKKLEVLKKNKISFDNFSLRHGIIIDKKKNIYILSGLFTRDDKWVIRSMNSFINSNGSNYFGPFVYYDLAYVIIYNMLNKKTIKFKK